MNLETHRRALWHVAYRMTGSSADADDIVQDAFARALAHEQKKDLPLEPWLYKITLNLCRDVLRRRKVRSYVGQWLPSPIELEDVPELAPSPEARYGLRESASFAFLIALEALTPRERAVLVLRDVLDRSVRDTAELLETSEDAVKSAHHRARRAMNDYEKDRAKTASAETEIAIAELLAALGRADADALASLLSSDVRATTDAGGVYRAALKTILGVDKVSRFLIAVSKGIRAPRVEPCMLNGAPAVIIETVPGDAREAPRSVLRIELDAAGKIREVQVISNPAKLAKARSA